MTQVSFKKKKRKEKEREKEQLRADMVRKLLEKLSHQGGNAVQIPQTLLGHDRYSSVKIGLRTVSTHSTEMARDTFSYSMI